MLHSLRAVHQVVVPEGVKVGGLNRRATVQLCDSSLHAVRAVGRVRKSHFEEHELIQQLFHMGVVCLILIEDPRTVPVNGLQVGFNTGRFVRLRPGISADEKGVTAPGIFFADERLEDLLIERILEGVILHQVEHRDAASHIRLALVVPVNESRVGGTVHEGLEDIEFGLDLSHQAHGLCAAT